MATTVIEVGVDVPEATVMVVEDADRFGIAQLHQLRGRVGRGGAPAGATCWARRRRGGGRALAAWSGRPTGSSWPRSDLDLRGEGTILGARQKGRSDLKLASLSDERDLELLDAARRVAEALVGEDPQLAAHPELADEVGCSSAEDEGEYLFKS